MRILILCTGNSCRSQMAEGYLRAFLNEEAEVVSAGTEVHGLNARAVQVMAEDGIDIAHHTSKLVDNVLERPFDLVLTVCDHAREMCPVVPGQVRYIHKSFPDPARVQGPEEIVLNAFRSTRNSIKAYCMELSVELEPR